MVRANRDPGDFYSVSPMREFNSQSAADLEFLKVTVAALFRRE
jgi:hypothetical protein